MYFFLLIIVPLVYCVSEFLCRGRKPARERMAAVFLGIVLACVYALIHFFAIGSFHIWKYSLSAVWLYGLFAEIIIPVSICLVAVFIGKDRFCVKSGFLFPVLSAFYAVFLPYRVFTVTISPDMFCMVLYPLLVASLLFNIDTAIFVFEDGAESGNSLWLKIIISISAVVTGLLLPTLFQALYFLNKTDVWMYVLAILFVLFAAGLRALAMIFLPKKNAA